MICGLVLTRQALMIATSSSVMVKVPASVTIVVQTKLVTAKELRFRLTLATFGVLQIWINLNSLLELGTRIVDFQVGLDGHKL